MSLLRCYRRSDRRGRAALAGQQLHSHGSKIKSILNAVVVIVVVIWLLQAFGLLGDLAGIRVGNT